MNNYNFSRTALTDEQRILVNSEVQRYAKSTVLTYLFWLTLGEFGAVRYYYGKTGSAIAMTLISLILGPLFGLGLFITVIWNFIDLFSLSSWINESQSEVESRVIQDLQAGRPVHENSENHFEQNYSKTTEAPQQNYQPRNNEYQSQSNESQSSTAQTSTPRPEPKREEQPTFEQPDTSNNFDQQPTAPRTGFKFDPHTGKPINQEENPQRRFNPENQSEPNQQPTTNSSNEPTNNQSFQPRFDPQTGKPLNQNHDNQN